MTTYSEFVFFAFPFRQDATKMKASSVSLARNCKIAAGLQLQLLEQGRGAGGWVPKAPNPIGIASGVGHELALFVDLKDFGTQNDTFGMEHWRLGPQGPRPPEPLVYIDVVNHLA